MKHRKVGWLWKSHGEIAATYQECSAVGYWFVSSLEYCWGLSNIGGCALFVKSSGFLKKMCYFPAAATVAADFF